jgi:endogenous inhibitor of DNA gyrase (YacG/DUF329 family)
MSTEFMGCPHCGTEIQKSAAAQILGGAGRFMVMGEAPKTVNCPACGQPIDVQAMLDGKYDRSRWPETVGAIGFLLFVGSVIAFRGMGEDWLPAFGWAFLVAAVASVILATLGRLVGGLLRWLRRR